MRLLKRLALAAVATSFVLSGIGTAQAAESTTINKIRERGALRVAGILNEDPYFNKDPRTGKWRGFAIDMARNIAATLGVKLEVVESSWGNSILDVQSGKVDLALALTAMPKRALSIYFTAPTYYNSFVIVSPKAEMKGLDWKALNDPKFTYSVDIGSSQDLIATQYLPKAKVLRFKTRDEAIIAVATGKADAIVSTVLNGMVMSKRNNRLGAVMVPKPVLSSPSVIGLNYDSDEVWKKFVSAWAEYHRRNGDNQTWIVKGLEPFGLGMEDLPEGFDIGG